MEHTYESKSYQDIPQTECPICGYLVSSVQVTSQGGWVDYGFFTEFYETFPVGLTTLPCLHEMEEVIFQRAEGEDDRAVCVLVPRVDGED